jgi:hypothetical protein
MWLQRRKALVSNCFGTWGAPSSIGNARVHPYLAKTMTKEPSSAAERMRLYRKRQRQGLEYVRILLHVTEIDALIHMGLLKNDQRTDADALQAAVLDLVYRATERNV